MHCTRDEISRWQIHGPAKLYWISDNIQSVNKYFEEVQAKFDFHLTESKSLIGDKYFMIQDLFGNSLQFLGKDN